VNAHDQLHDSTDDEQLAATFAPGAVDGYACSHTRAPALKLADRGFVINNGVAGPAFRIDHALGRGIPACSL
jgi:hypothetical protein